LIILTSLIYRLNEPKCAHMNPSHCFQWLFEVPLDGVSSFLPQRLSRDTVGLCDNFMLKHRPNHISLPFKIPPNPSLPRKLNHKALTLNTGVFIVRPLSQWALLKPFLFTVLWLCPNPWCPCGQNRWRIRWGTCAGCRWELPAPKSMHLDRKVSCNVRGEKRKKGDKCPKHCMFWGWEESGGLEQWSSHQFCLQLWRSMPKVWGEPRAGSDEQFWR
jgi:hypothetical protein